MAGHLMGQLVEALKRHNDGIIKLQNLDSDLFISKVWTKRLNSVVMPN